MFILLIGDGFVIAAVLVFFVWLFNRITSDAIISGKRAHRRGVVALSSCVFAGYCAVIVGKVGMILYPNVQF